MRRIALPVMVALALIAAGCGDEESAARAGYSRTPAPEVGDITVLDYAATGGETAGDATAAMGVDVKLRAAPGELLVLYLGFLSCPDVCPLTLSDLARGYNELDPSVLSRIQTGFLSVDPERDTGPEIDAYLSNFFDRHQALLAPDDEVLGTVLDRLAATVEIAEHEPGDENYDVAHTAVTYVVDSAGTVVWEFPFGTSDVDMAAALADLLSDLEV